MATPTSTSANATILCTECNHQSTFPKVYLSMGTRKSFTYFCGNCGTVTLHTIHQLEEQPRGRGAEGAEPSTAARGASSLPPNDSNQAEVSPSPSGGVNRFKYDPVRHAASRQLETEQSQGEAGRPEDNSPVDLNTEELWGKLSKMLDDSQVPLADLFRCDDTTRMRMFAALGFEKYEQERLLILSKERDPKNSMAINSPAPAPPANVPNAADGKPPTAPGGLNTSSTTGGAPNTSSYGLYGLQGNSQPSMPTSAKTAAPYVGWKPSQMTAMSGGGVRAPLHSARAPSIPGVYMNGEHMVARCTVYPELPAEFWCCACNVLVSSRCHVQGIHKDHPFISMRLAAETYVRDTAAWADRCRTQLNIVNTVVGNLQHSHGVLDQAVHHQFEALDKSVDQMVRDIYMWRDQLKADVAQQVTAEHLTIEQATAQAHALHELYNEHLKEAEPLLGNMPPATQHDGASDDWALKFLDFVTRLKHVSTEPVTMPKILVPEIRCTFSTPMVMDLLKHVNNPISIRLPDIIDPGYFHYPHPTASTRTPFVLALPQDGRQKGVIVENGRTLTRAQDVAPSHTLVTGSQIFYSGTNSWEVHVDRVGQGVGRILAGVIIQGSDGEGVVWDGYRIVGPNEGESRTISEKYKTKPGSVLRFVLELDAPNNYLNCFFEREGVARIPLPAASSGWVPAFSVFGPQDQITVVPTQGAGAMEGSIPKAGASSSLALSGVSNAQQIDLLTKAKLEQQELMIASLQKQLETIATKIEAKGSAADTTNSTRPQYSNPNALSEREALEWLGKQRMHQFQQQQHQQQQAVAADQTNSFNFRADSSIPVNNVTPGRIATPALPQGGQQHQQAQYSEGGTQRRGAGGVASHYSPELAQLLKFVDEIK